MSVVIETTLGDLTVDLFLDKRPLTCLNFLKLCKLKYYNYHLFHTIQHGFIAQTGDPTGKGDGGQSVWGVFEGESKKYFQAEQIPKIKHSNPGLLSMVCLENGMVGSQFFFTLASDLNSLDGQHCVIGEVTEGMEVLRLLNETICDSTYRPYQDVRITHTVILEDPFNDPLNIRAPSRSPSPSAERLVGGRIAPDEELDETKGKTEEEIAEIIQEKEAKARATILEIVGDLPDADMAPPENVLFVCKLNPVTTDDDLEIIFSRFGKVNCCEVIRDRKTGDSLQYAFIEFDNKKSCEDAYFKMDNVLIDDRRIHVDFSQSVSKIKWRGKGRGVIHMDGSGKPVEDNKNVKNSDERDKQKNNSNGRGSRDNDRTSKQFSDARKDRTPRRDYISNKKNEQTYRDRLDDRYGSNRYDSRRRSRDKDNFRDRRRDSPPRYLRHENRSQFNSTHDRRNESSRSRSKYDRERDSRYVEHSKNNSRSRYHTPRRTQKDSPNHDDSKISRFKKEKSPSPRKESRHVLNSPSTSIYSDSSSRKLEKDCPRNSISQDIDVKKRKLCEPVSKDSDSDEGSSPSKKKKSSSDQNIDSKNGGFAKLSITSNDENDKIKSVKRNVKVSSKKSKKKKKTSSSESSSSDSEDSSSSSSDSEPKKKSKKNKNVKKKKFIKSSSSSSSDSSSSSSSDSSSSSSSSESSHGASRKKKKTKKSGKNKNIKKKRCK